MAHSESAIAPTRRSGARLDLVDDSLRIWFRGQGRPMGVVPSTFLAIHTGDQTFAPKTISGVASPARRSVPIGICLRSDERGVEGLPLTMRTTGVCAHTYLIRLLQRGKTSGRTVGVVLILVRMMEERKTSEGTLS